MSANLCQLKPSRATMDMLGMSGNLKNAKTTLSEFIEKIKNTQPGLAKALLLMPVKGMFQPAIAYAVVEKMSDLLSQKTSLKDAAQTWSMSKDMPIEERITDLLEKTVKQRNDNRQRQV